MHFLTSCNQCFEWNISWKVLEKRIIESWKTLEFGLCKSWKKAFEYLYELCFMSTTRCTSVIINIFHCVARQMLSVAVLRQSASFWRSITPTNRWKQSGPPSSWLWRHCWKSYSPVARTWRWQWWGELNRWRSGSTGLTLRCKQILKC